MDGVLDRRVRQYIFMRYAREILRMVVFDMADVYRERVLGDRVRTRALHAGKIATCEVMVVDVRSDHLPAFL